MCGVEGDVCTVGWVWRSENSSQESISSLYCVQGTKLRQLGFVAIAFSHWATVTLMCKKWERDRQEERERKGGGEVDMILYLQMSEYLNFMKDKKFHDSQKFKLCLQTPPPPRHAHARKNKQKTIRKGSFQKGLTSYQCLRSALWCDVLEKSVPTGVCTRWVQWW